MKGSTAPTMSFSMSSICLWQPSPHAEIAISAACRYFQSPEDNHSCVLFFFSTAGAKQDLTSAVEAVTTRAAVRQRSTPGTASMNCKLVKSKGVETHRNALTVCQHGGYVGYDVRKHSFPSQTTRQSVQSTFGRYGIAGKNKSSIFSLFPGRM